jgi:hypothetical protein
MSPREILCWPLSILAVLLVAIGAFFILLSEIVVRSAEKLTGEKMTNIRVFGAMAGDKPASASAERIHPSRRHDANSTVAPILATSARSQSARG